MVDVVVIPTTRPPVPQAMLQPMPERVRLILDLEPAEGPVFGHLEQPGDGVRCDFRGYVALIAAIEDARRAVPSGPAAEAQGDGP